MKTIIIGDIHGKTVWEKIVKKEENADKFVLIGDYFDAFDIAHEHQINNFIQLIKWKEGLDESKKSEVIMLVGNHDLHYFPDATADARCSGYNESFAFTIGKLLDNNKKHLRVCHEMDNFLFTHAGIGDVFLEEKGWEEGLRIDEFLNDLWELDINIFAYDQRDFTGYGNDVRQTPLWIRPAALVKGSNNLFKKYIQVVGHTKMKYMVADAVKGFIFIDVLDSYPQYLIIEDGSISVGEIKEKKEETDEV